MSLVWQVFCFYIQKHFSGSTWWWQVWHLPGNFFFYLSEIVYMFVSVSRWCNTMLTPSEGHHFHFFSAFNMYDNKGFDFCNKPSVQFPNHPLGSCFNKWSQFHLISVLTKLLVVDILLHSSALMLVNWVTSVLCSRTSSWLELATLN